MTTSRIAINIRVFGLAATIGLAGATQALPRVLVGYLLLCAIAAVASLPQPSHVAGRTAPVIEAALVGLTLSVTGAIDQPLGLYLMVPALLAGLAGGPSTVSAAFLAELGAIALVPIVRQDPGLLTASLRETLPWVLTAIGLGLLGSWIRRLRTAPVDADHARYVAAYRLLHQLRLVSRGLSAGLDPVVLSANLLDECLACLPDARGAVLARTEGGVFVSLAQRDVEVVPGGLGNDPLVMQCWTTVQTASRIGASDPPSRQTPYTTGVGAKSTSDGRTRCALPLKVGTRMVGVLALDIEKPLDAPLHARLQALLDERALPLDAALLFDEVRTLATVEERHRLAREIHDGVAQEIASLGYLVDDLASAADGTDRAARVRQLRGELSRIVNDLRLSIFDLRSQVSRTTGLGAVLGDYLREVGSRSGTAVHLSVDESPDRLRLEVEEELLRIVQEAVTNARKHSNADNLWVTCHVRPPAADVVVEDDGSGPSSAVQKDGFGLSIMRERAHRIGATLAVTRRTGGGTRVSISLHPSPDVTSALAEAAPTLWTGRRR
ncbi:MAG: histidine kinase, partial [Actinomycetota bacterium]|nr:histidine kinase [Actinomycetota bacterium]